MKKNASESVSLKESTTREKVLKNVRNALLEPSDSYFKDIEMDSSVYVPMQEDIDIQFAYELTASGAKFIYCSSPSDMLQKVKALFADYKWTEACCNEELIAGLLNHAKISNYQSKPDAPYNHIAVTSCECLIARTGSIVMSSGLESGRKLPFTCDIHIVIAFTSQVVKDVKQAMEFLRIKYGQKLPSMISIISGTSRNDDIEKVMVPAGYGAKEIFVFMADEDSTDNQ